MSTPGSGRWSRRPKLVVAGYAVFTVLVCIGLKDLWYDHNLLNLQAEGLESVKLEKKLLQSDCGASFAVVMAKSREELIAAESDVCQSGALPDGRLGGGNRLLRAGQA